MRSETTPAALQHRSVARTDPGIIDPSEVATVDQLGLAWDELARLEAAREGCLAGGRLDVAPNLSTGSANPGVAFTGRELIRPNWRQGRGTIDPTGVNNGLVWELIAPGDTGDLSAMARSVHYDGTKALTWAPRGTEIVTIQLVPGVARALAVSPSTHSAVVTFIAGTTTYAELAADWAASYQATQLAVFTGDAGTIPATFEGGTLYLSKAPLVEYVQDSSTSVDWDATTRTVTVALDIAGGGDSVANILTALAAGVPGAKYVVQTRNVYGSTGAGDVTTAGFVQLTGGSGRAMRRAYLLMAQGANKDLLFVDRQFGHDAIPVSLSLANDAAAEPPVVTVAESETRVHIGIKAKIGTATALHIRQAVRDSLAAQRWLSVRLAPGSNGSGNPTAIAATALSGGEDSDALELDAGAVAGTGFTALTDDGFTVDLPALGGSYPAGDPVRVRARICGVWHEIDALVVA